MAPDVVTLGKPMGNGYPVAAVIARQELFDRLKEETEVFSTFGGNPVAASSALAVLDVIEDERLVEAMRFLFERLKLVVEPSGAAGVAALLSGAVDVAGRSVGVILSGGNVDAARFATLVGAPS